MNDIATYYYDRLREDATLVQLLAEYDNRPAIFTAQPPDDAVLPYIEVSIVSSPPFDSKEKKGVEDVRDVHCYADLSGDSTLVDLIAQTVREIFHKRTLTSSGESAYPGADQTLDDRSVYVSTVLGVTPTDDEESYGRVVTVRLFVQER